MGVLSELKDLKGEAVESVSNAFAWWARFVYRHSYWVIAASLFLLAFCSIGLIPPIPQWIDGAENLYALPVSLARDHGAIHRSLFEDVYSRANFVIVTSATDPNENIFTWDHLNQVNQLDKLIRGKIVDNPLGHRIAVQRPTDFVLNDKVTQKEIRSSDTTEAVVDDVINELIDEDILKKREDDRGDASDKILTFQDICSKNSNQRCSVESVLEMGVFEIRDSLLPEGHPPELYMFDEKVIAPDLRGLVVSYLMSKIQAEPCERELPKKLAEAFVEPEDMKKASNPLLALVPTTCITGASAFLMVYNLRDSPEMERVNVNWEKVLIDVLKDNEIFGPLKVTLNAFRSRDDELRTSTSGSTDILFVILTFVIIIGYSCSLNFSCDLYRSKSYPALAGGGAALLGLASGLGFVSLLGVAFVPTALICPFLVMGIGVDDMFVIVNSYSLAYMVDTASDRIAVAMKDAGLSITITTMTNLIAFGVGAFSPYLSIRNFCYFSAAGLFFGYVFCLSFFLAFLCIDAKREEAKRVCIFCLPAETEKERKVKSLRKTNEVEISTFSLVSFKARTLNRGYGQSALGLAKRTMSKQNSLKKNIDPPDAKPYTTGIADRKARLQTSGASIGNRNSNNHSIIDTDRMMLADSERGLSLRTLSDSRVHNLYPTNASNRNPLDPHVDIDLESNQVRLYQEAIRAVQRNGGVISRQGSESNDNWTSSAATTTPDREGGSSPSESHVCSFIEDAKELVNAHEVYFEEPKGNVGRLWRSFFLTKYGPFLTNKYVKIGVLLFFTAFISISVRGLVSLEQGLDLKELSPINSYLREFDKNLEVYFNEYDVPVDIFFPNHDTEWWTEDAQQNLEKMHIELQDRPTTKMVVNPLLRMLEDPTLSSRLRSGDRQTFESTLFNELSQDGPYHQFEADFVWQGSQLVGWKFTLLPAAMRTSRQRAAWMIDIRSICDSYRYYDYPLIAYAYNYMMIFYESDLGILSSVLINMTVAAVAMLLVAFVLIPQLVAALLVILTMILIDIGLFGFMYFWSVNLNMVSMINLVISIGFAVDYSAHICHTFTHCEGETRDLRTIETLVLMGNPVFHGAISTLLGVFMLGFSTSYIFQVFYKMFLLVVVFGILHGVVLLPVLLSLIGTMEHHADVQPLEVVLQNKDWSSTKSSKKSHLSNLTNSNLRYNSVDLNNDKLELKRKSNNEVLSNHVGTRPSNTLSRTLPVTDMRKLNILNSVGSEAQGSIYGEKLDVDAHKPDYNYVSSGRRAEISRSQGKMYHYNTASPVPSNDPKYTNNALARMSKESHFRPDNLNVHFRPEQPIENLVQIRRRLGSPTAKESDIDRKQFQPYMRDNNQPPSHTPSLHPPASSFRHDGRALVGGPRAAGRSVSGAAAEECGWRSKHGINNREGGRKGNSREGGRKGNTREGSREGNREGVAGGDMIDPQRNRHRLMPPNVRNYYTPRDVYSENRHVYGIHEQQSTRLPNMP